MASAVSISTTIDDLIQRIDKVKVCQDHLKLVTTSLTRLRYQLNKTSATKDGSGLHEEIAQTLKTIDEVVVSCSVNETEIKGITYRDLQSILIRLQLRLAEHEANLTDDYEAKVNILSNAYHEQQILVQKIYDETMKERLAFIEQRTKANTEEQLRVLREKHVNTIESYLRCSTELHKSVPLSGLTGTVVAEVAHTFYQISSDDQIQLERKWQSCELPLTRTFVQFKADKSTSFERNESRRLLIGPESNLLQGPHSRKEASKGIWQRLVSAPYMMSMFERDRYVEEENLTEEDIIRTKRWIVILGDPGSGKTSFARWLVRHLAQTLLLNGQHSTDYGPLRIPILIRIGEFAEILSKKPSLTLFDYIGKHKWMGKIIVDDSSITLDSLRNALQNYIKEGHALIILDGLDEIPVSDLRSKIINAVENFVESHVQTPAGTSALDSSHLSKLFDDPSRSGGNQLIVTSRIVGYHAAPLAGQFAHYTIRPMDKEHMKDFVDYWFLRVHQQILDSLDLSMGNRGQDHGEALKKELENTENVGLLDVASNSCLMSFICSVAFSQSEGLPLPTQRIHLYEEIVNSMLSSWSSKGSTIHIPKLIRILSDIATHIHDNSASGLIHEEKMKEVCIQSIRMFLNKKLYTDKDDQDIEKQASEFVRIFREDVGILAARGESLYGFLHLTFQEYFTCLKLIDVDKLKQERLVIHGSSPVTKVQLVAESLRRHINDPRFRVPIALALGKISSTWSQKDFDDFCLEFIEEQDKSNSLLPLGAYMLISCSKDLVNYPSNNVLFNVLDSLMIAAGQHKWSVVSPFLIEQVTNGFRKLQNDIVSLWINNLLARSPSHDIQTISALCRLLEGKSAKFENIDWLNQSSCSTLQSLSVLDNESNEFAIDRLLVKIAFSNHRLLPVQSNTFKEFLLAEEIELNSIPVILFPLIIALYGGLKRDDRTIVFDPFYIYRESAVITPILIRFLSKNVRDNQDQSIMSIKQECLRSFLMRIENHDLSSEAVDLCIATICLYGIDYLQENNNLISNSLFRTSMNRLKYISMILRQYYFTTDETDRSIENETTKFISTVINKFPYGDFSKQQFLDLLNSLKSSLARLRSSATSVFLEGISLPGKRVTLHLPNSLRKEYNFLNDLLSTDIRLDSDQMSCSLIYHFTKLFWVLEHNDEFQTQYRMAVAMDEFPQYLLFRNDEDLLFPLTFVPEHLRNLYLRLLKQRCITINSKDLTVIGTQHLCFGHILIECLMSLSNTTCKKYSPMSALIALLPMLRMHQLENFGSSLLWIFATKDSSVLNTFETIRQYPMNYETGQYIDKDEHLSPATAMSDGERRTLIKDCIEQEHQRLRDALTDNDRQSMKLYSASVSLARICRWTQGANRLCLLEESVQGAMSINNKLTRLDALCVIAFYSHSDYDQIQVSKNKSLQKEIEYQLNDIYSDLPLLLHTAIFIRCLPLLQNQHTIGKCFQNLFNKFTDADQQDQQVAHEALAPYLKSNSAFFPILEQTSANLANDHRTVNNRSSVLKEYFNIHTYESFSSSLLMSNLYLAELASDFQECVETDDFRLFLSQSNLYTNDKALATSLFRFGSPMMTVAQAFAITNYLSSLHSSNLSKHSTMICIVLSDALNHFNLVEFKACRLLESWIKWKDSNELSSFAYHAALLLANSDLWSVEAATIVCDLLCSDNDRFRQRAETILRLQSDDNDIRTSSKLGLDVLLTFAKKEAYYEHSSPFASLTLLRMFGNITLDIQSHLESFLWLERYRIHAWNNQEYSLKISKSSPIAHVASYFPTDITRDVSFCFMIRRISGDLIQYICDLITSNFSSYLDIDGDTTSNTILESHVQFVVSVLILIGTLINHTDETRALTIDALTISIKTSRNNEIRRAAAYALGYVCDKETYKVLFSESQAMVNNEAKETSNYSDNVISAWISSYCHYVSVNDIEFDEDDMDMFRQLLKHPSQKVLKAVHVGLGRVLKNSSLLFEMLGADYIQCYHALINATQYVYAYDVRQASINAVGEFIEEHPDLLSIFVVELYNSIRHFTNGVIHVKTIDYYLAYAYPAYVEVAGLIAVRMPAAFCAYIKEWHDGGNLKLALFYTSKQHNYPQRAACLTILSVFGELTVELCEMIIEALRDDPHIQNTCYKCLTRINSIKDEEVVLNLLFSYLKSKSMNVRYAAAKILLHLSQSSLIPRSKVQIVLNELMSDLTSNEDLWLIEEQDNINAQSEYYYAGRLKDVIYSLLVRHLTGDASGTIRRNELNDIDLDFMKSEKASRLSSCLYEERTEENLEAEKPSKSSFVLDNDDDSTSNHFFPEEHESDQDEKEWISKTQESDNHQLPNEDVDAPVEMVMINKDNEEQTHDKSVQSVVVSNDINSPSVSSRVPIPKKKTSKFCIIL